MDQVVQEYENEQALAEELKKKYYLPSFNRDRALTDSELSDRVQLGHKLLVAKYTHHPYCYSITPPVEGITSKPKCNCKVMF